MLIASVFTNGIKTSPRGMPTIELEGATVAFDMHYPVLECPPRKMSYRFMVAEAWWILVGSDLVRTIVPYNKNIADFSDDGRTFYGAYGPKYVDQLEYVVNTLLADPDSRQAVINIWRENPKPSKDIPCTLSLIFHLRGNRLNVHVTMRSSDIWLGTVYDWFNYSMMAAYVLGHLNVRGMTKKYELGTCYWYSASAHFYEKNYEGLKTCLESEIIRPDESVRMPDDLPPGKILEVLLAARDDHNFNHPYWSLRRR